MPFNMAWFKARDEKRKAEEAAKLAAEGISKVNEEEKIEVSAQGTDDSGYYKFHKNSDPKNKHYFLCEELLVPHANSTDTQRGNM